MSATARRLSTFEQLYGQLQTLPQNMRGEIIDGQIYAMTRPFSPHASAQAKLMIALGSYTQRQGGPGEPGGWILHFEPELHFPSPFFEKNVLIPDLAGWRREHLPKLPRSGYLDIVPDWVCEVLSPGTAGMDRGLKRRIYGEVGVEWLWLVDPESQSLEVERWTGTQWHSILSGGRNDRLKAPPFDAVEIALERLWEDVEE